MSVHQFANYYQGAFVNTQEEPKGELLVQDIMTADVFTLFEEDSLKIAEDIMDFKNIRHIPVVNCLENIVGLITHRDLLRMSISTLAGISKEATQSLNDPIKVQDVMNRQVMTVPPKTPLSKAAALMFTNKLGCLPVVHEGALVGIITEADFVRLLAEHSCQVDQ